MIRHNRVKSQIAETDYKAVSDPPHDFIVKQFKSINLCPAEPKYTLLLQKV